VGIDTEGMVRRAEVEQGYDDSVGDGEERDRLLAE